MTHVSPPAVRGRAWPSIHGHARLGAVLGAVTIAFSSIFVRLSHTSASTSAIFRCLYALPVLLLLAWAEERRFGPRDWQHRRAGLLAGVFFACDVMLWNRSIAEVGAGLATVLANVQVVLLPLAAWALLRERPGRRILLVLPLALLGVALISGVFEHGAYGRNPTQGTLLGFGAGVAYVGFLMLLRQAGADRRRPAGPLCEATLVAFVLCLLAGVAIGDADLVPSWPGHGWLVALALGSQVLGWLLLTSSLPRLPSALGSMLLTVQPIGSVVLAAIIFGESPSGLQLGGAGLVLVALLAAGAAARPAGAEADVGDVGVGAGAAPGARAGGSKVAAVGADGGPDAPALVRR